MTKDRTIAYNVFLRRLGVEAQNLDYKDAAHGFASMEVLMNSREAEGCAEDIAIWVHKHISPKGGSFRISGARLKGESGHSLYLNNNETF